MASIIDREFVKCIKYELKTNYPEWKFLVKRYFFHEGIHISILAGPIEMIIDPSNTHRYKKVVRYYIGRNYPEEGRNLLLNIYEIADRNHGIEIYSFMPDYDIDVEIGK